MFLLNSMWHPYFITASYVSSSNEFLSPQIQIHDRSIPPNGEVSVRTDRQWRKANWWCGVTGWVEFHMDLKRNKISQGVHGSCNRVITLGNAYFLLRSPILYIVLRSVTRLAFYFFRHRQVAVGGVVTSGWRHSSRR